MRRLRLWWARVRPIFCALGWHRWEVLYGPGRPGGVGSGKYGRTVTCVACGDER